MSRHLRLLTTAFLVVALVCGTALAGPGPLNGGVDGDPDGPMRASKSTESEGTAPAARVSMVAPDEGARTDVQVKADWWLSMLRLYFRLSGILPR